MVVEDKPRKNTSSDGPRVLLRRHGMKPTRERGRDARTSLPAASGISSSRVDRQRRRDSAPAEPIRSSRQGGRVPHCRETERHRKGVHAGGTPALPGGPLSSRLPFNGESAQPNRLDGRHNSRFDNPFVDYSFFVSGKSGSPIAHPTSACASGCRRSCCRGIRSTRPCWRTCGPECGLLPAGPGRSVRLPSEIPTPV